MWYKNNTFYQIYPFGFCGAPDTNDETVVNRIQKISGWIPHMKNTGVNALYLCPVFESDAHGYDTRDYTRIDCRLGSNEDFAQVSRDLHEAGIRLVLDGVFNHVGRGFWAFEDVKKNRESSAYKDWFTINFGGNSNYNDGFWYEGWEGHYNLVKLNLKNPQVVNYLFDCIRGWVEAFDIDGLRLDVAYMMDEGFLRQLSSFCKSLKPDFYLVGEIIHGDYNRLTGSGMLDSCTNYECFKGIYSSFNDRNMFEIAYSFNRQFNSLYPGLSLFNFADNHDVTRLASNLTEPRHLKAAYGLLFGMVGVPCIYYGSEWGAEGVKTSGSDANLRPCFEKPVENELTTWIAALSRIRSENPALESGDYSQVYLTNPQFVFARKHADNEVIVAINAADTAHTANLPLQGDFVNLHTEKTVSCNGTLEMPPFSCVFYRRK